MTIAAGFLLSMATRVLVTLIYICLSYAHMQMHLFCQPLCINAPLSWCDSHPPESSQMQPSLIAKLRLRSLFPVPPLHTD